MTQGLGKSFTRNCGSCYVCCVTTGINELKKHSGQTCKHLSGASGPEKRCSIYSSRPSACSNYVCAWIAGLGPENSQPNLSGVLCTLYSSNHPEIPQSATLHVHDKTKSGPWQGPGHLFDLLKQLMEIGCDNDIRIVFQETKQVIYFLNGVIRQGKLLPQEKYEDLNFQLHDPPLGHYEIRHEEKTT